MIRPQACNCSSWSQIRTPVSCRGCGLHGNWALSFNSIFCTWSRKGNAYQRYLQRHCHACMLLLLSVWAVVFSFLPFLEILMQMQAVLTFLFFFCCLSLSTLAGLCVPTLFASSSRQLDHLSRNCLSGEQYSTSGVLLSKIVRIIETVGIFRRPAANPTGSGHAIGQSPDFLDTTFFLRDREVF